MPITIAKLHQGVDLAMRGKELQALVNKHTEDFPSRRVPDGLAPHGNVYLLTGTTGCLGSNMLVQLLEAPATTRVYTFNRPSKSATLQARQLSAFKQRGLDTDLLSYESLCMLRETLLHVALP